MNIRATPAQPPRPRYLMCRPQHFAVTYSINPWMDPKAWADSGDALHATAARQWAGLHRALLCHGALIEQVEPAPDLPDLVFTANAAVVLDGKALLARFRHPERQREQPVYAQSFRALQARGLIDEVIEMPDGAVLEGAGDCLWDGHRGTFWMGCGFRSDKTAAAVVEAARHGLRPARSRRSELLPPRHRVLPAAVRQRHLPSRRAAEARAASTAGRAADRIALDPAMPRALPPAVCSVACWYCRVAARRFAARCSSAAMPSSPRRSPLPRATDRPAV
jgi:hypothetical protein